MYDEDGKFDRLTVNDQEKAEALSEFFSSVFITENDEEVPQLPKMTAKVLNEVDITEEVVLKKLNALKISKSPGPDGIHPRVLRELKDNLAKPLTAIFKDSLGSETVPQNWKRGLITPIYKKGKKSIPGNYRPVSLTPCNLL